MDLTYGSDIRDEAMIVETLILMNKKNDAASLVKNIAGKLSSRTWMSTQTTAYALMAVSKYTLGAKGEGMEVSWKLDNGKEEKISTRKTVASARLQVADKTGKSSISIKNDGKNVVMGRIISRGIPANDEAKASESNLRMSVSYTTADGKPLDLSAIPRGTVFYATITVTNPGLRGMYRQLALTQPVAAGWEIINSRMSDFAAAGTSASAFQYQDIRDERIFTYFDLSPGAKTFRVMLTAAYAGRYYLPPLYCEAMYDNSIHALIPGRWVEVIHEAQ
jgi:uncharacterized protein YfaS (alpha-2-macroglobulin family)